MGRWFVPFGKGRVDNSRLTLYCFPYAGGAESCYNGLFQRLDNSFCLKMATLPGRGARIAEPPVEDLKSIISFMADELLTHSEIPYAFFGHSMGGMLSYELAIELRKREMSLPMALFLSGARPPHRFGEPDSNHSHKLPREDFIEHIRRIGGTPKEWFSCQELIDLTLPALRSDFCVCETYTHIPRARLKAPIFALGGERDTSVAPSCMHTWKDYTEAGFSLSLFDGEHFFIHDHWNSIAQIINNGIADTEGSWSNATRRISKFKRGIYVSTARS